MLGDGESKEIFQSKLIILAGANRSSFFNPDTIPLPGMGVPTAPFSQHSFFGLIYVKATEEVQPGVDSNAIFCCVTSIMSLQPASERS